MPNRGKASRLFMAGHYRAIADIINGIEDALLRKEAADHFATEFRKRYPSGFDPAQFAALCGGRVRGFNIRTGRFVDEGAARK